MNSLLLWQELLRLPVHDQCNAFQFLQPKAAAGKAVRHDEPVFRRMPLRLPELFGQLLERGLAALQDLLHARADLRPVEKRLLPGRRRRRRNQSSGMRPMRFQR